MPNRQLLLENLGPSEDEATAHANAAAAAALILDALNQPYQLGDYRHASTPSIGITLFCDDAADTGALLMQADLAIYQAKAAGRNAMRFFDPTMREAAAARMSAEGIVVAACGRDDRSDAVIARTIVTLGCHLGLRVIAEGVEDERQRDFLFQVGCDRLFVRHAAACRRCRGLRAGHAGTRLNEKHRATRMPFARGRAIVVGS